MPVPSQAHRIYMAYKPKQLQRAEMSETSSVCKARAIALVCVMTAMSR